MNRIALESLFFLVLILFATSLSGQILIDHLATKENTFSGYTVIDHDVTNNQIDAILVIKHVANLKRTDQSPDFGVVYEEGQWCVFTKDGNDLPLDAAFTIAVENIPGDEIFTIALTLPKSKGLIHIKKPTTESGQHAKLFITEKRDSYTEYSDLSSDLQYKGAEWYIQYEGQGLAGEIVKYNVLIEMEDEEPSHQEAKETAYAWRVKNSFYENQKVR